MHLTGWPSLERFCFLDFRSWVSFCFCIFRSSITLSLVSVTSSLYLSLSLPCALFCFSLSLSSLCILSASLIVGALFVSLVLAFFLIIFFCFSLSVCVYILYTCLSVSLPSFSALCGHLGRHCSVVIMHAARLLLGRGGAVLLRQPVTTSLSPLFRSAVSLPSASMHTRTCIHAPAYTRTQTHTLNTSVGVPAFARPAVTAQVSVALTQRHHASMRSTRGAQRARWRRRGTAHEGEAERAREQGGWGTAPLSETTDTAAASAKSASRGKRLGSKRPSLLGSPTSPGSKAKAKSRQRVARQHHAPHEGFFSQGSGGGYTVPPASAQTRPFIEAGGELERALLTTLALDATEADPRTLLHIPPLRRLRLWLQQRQLAKVFDVDTDELRAVCRLKEGGKGIRMGTEKRETRERRAQRETHKKARGEKM